jgi:hypothetical protein
MMITQWLRPSERRSQFFAVVSLGVAIIWALYRTARSLQIHSAAMHETPTHDLYTYYSIWYVLCHRDCADIALRGSLYLPHTWLFFTPLFIFGWSAARAMMFCLNVASAIYICLRLSRLVGLRGIQPWLLLAFFWSWSSTGNVLGLGNLALVCLAAVLAAYPFESRVQGLWLAFSAMKQSLVFPLYFLLLFKRPKSLIVPFAIFTLGGLLILWWTRLNLREGLEVFRSWVGSVSNWTTVDYTCLRRPLAFFIQNKRVLSIVIWGIWFLLFLITVRWIKDPLALLAGLLLLCLLPMYHNAYDMVVAVPAMAIFLKRCPLFWSAAMTFALAWDPLRQLSRWLPAGPCRNLSEALEVSYLPCLILVFIGGLLYLETRSRPESVAAPGGEHAPLSPG